MSSGFDLFCPCIFAPQGVPTTASCENGITIIDPAVTYDCTTVEGHVIINDRSLQGTTDGTMISGNDVFPSGLTDIFGSMIIRDTTTVSHVDFPNLNAVQFEVTIENNGPALKDVSMIGLQVVNNGLEIRYDKHTCVQ